MSDSLDNEVVDRHIYVLSLQFSAKLDQLVDIYVHVRVRVRYSALKKENIAPINKKIKFNFICMYKYS